MANRQAAFWRDKTVLVSGHTGFKGAWLCLWLAQMGAKVNAFALQPASDPNLFSLLQPWACERQEMIDLADKEVVSRFVRAVDPEFVFHLAAQSLVRPSYRDPVGTYMTNVMGTGHVLEAIRGLERLRAAVIVTTDKVYENDGSGRAFVEGDRLGGKDPYSNSKACAELLTQSFRDCFFGSGAKIVTVRAGNVVGGGDWSLDRLVPDIIRAMLKGEPISLRYPTATRPWQHVLEPLSGYLMLAQKLVEAPEGMPKAFNFGPDLNSNLTVAEVVDILNSELGLDSGWIPQPGDHPPEAPALALNSELTTQELGWHPKLTMFDTVRWTAEWYKHWRDGDDPKQITLAQIDRYQSL